MKISGTNAPALVAHCHNLCLLAGVEPNFYTGYKLYEKLRRLELKAHRLAERECNGEIDPEQPNGQRYKICASVWKLLPRLDAASFFLNGDPRGYSLKIDEQNHLYPNQQAFLGNPDMHRDPSESVASFIKANNFYRDFGGYGILAPEL